MFRNLAVALSLLVAAPALAQQINEQVLTTTRDQVQRQERAARESTDANEYFRGLGNARTGLRAGGWMSFTFIDFTDLLHARSLRNPVDSLTLPDLRVWVSDTSHGNELYVRFRKSDFDFQHDPAQPFLDTRTKDQFDLDLGWYDWAWGKAHVRAGRSFMFMGRGLVLADVYDGVQVRTRTKCGVELSGLYGTSLHRQDNLDTRVTGFDRGHNDRDFAGVQADYTTKKHQIHYDAFALAQIDRTRSEDPAQDALDFRYQSHYFGAGSSGVWHKRLSYANETVLERGSSAGFDGGRADVSAWASTAAFDYSFPGKNTPSITLDYAYGSGDSNRQSVTSSLDLGASRFTGDKNFLYFGQYDGGLALAPRLSNIEVWRLGARCRPFPGAMRWPSDMLAGFKVSDYHKNRVTGVISDPLATQPFSHVGTAVDLFMSWKILSDLNLLVEYGSFKPSSAYAPDARDLTERFAVTSTLTF